MAQHRIVDRLHQRHRRLGVDSAAQPHVAKHFFHHAAAVFEDAARAHHFGLDAHLGRNVSGACGAFDRRSHWWFGGCRRGRRRSGLFHCGGRSRFHVQPTCGVDHQLLDAAVVDLAHIVGIDQEGGLPERMVHPRAQQLVDIHARAELVGVDGSEHAGAGLQVVRIAPTTGVAGLLSYRQPRRILWAGRNRSRLANRQ